MLKKQFLPYSLLALFSLNNTALAETKPQVGSSLDDSLKKAMVLCQQEQSPLVRLDCYDKLLKEVSPQDTSVFERSSNTLKILHQEKDRQSDSTDFVITENRDKEPVVIVTTPALGAMPPRPLLAFSCIENITRMQIIFFDQVPIQDNLITIKTDTGVTINSRWFIRDNGYLIENSRGLIGISEIRKILETNPSHIAIESSNRILNGLSFNISGLSQALKPLRSTCRW